MGISAAEITIVIVRAPGYSGATWVNLVLGCHPEAMAMGPPQRILTLNHTEADAACFVHRDHCSFWPAFIRDGDHDGRFFLDLAGYSGKRLFILNYPPKQLLKREIYDQGFKVRHIKLVRDGRANVFSYLRHQSLSVQSDLVQAIRQWLLLKWDQIDRKMPEDSAEWMLMRYEDMVAEPHQMLAQLGEFIGVDSYPSDSHLFWRYEHHLTAGNTGVIDTLCRLNGYPGWWHHRKDAYDKIVGQLMKEPALPVIDNSWKNEFSTHDRLVFDVLAGARNAAYGYERDLFSADERAACLHSVKKGDSFWPRIFKRIKSLQRKC